MEMNNDDVLIALRHVPEWLDCPECGELTNSLKDFRLIDELFSLLFYHKWSMIDIIACPGCMRKNLIRRMIITIASSNFIWPLVPLPHYSYFLIHTLIPGHSKSICKEFEDAYKLALRRKKWADEDRMQEG